MLEYLETKKKNLPIAKQVLLSGICVLVVAFVKS